MGVGVGMHGVTVIWESHDGASVTRHRRIGIEHGRAYQHSTHLASSWPNNHRSDLDVQIPESGSRKLMPVAGSLLQAKAA